MKRKTKTKTRRRKQKGGTRQNRRNLRAIIAYERNPARDRILPENTMSIGERIRLLLEAQEPLKAPLEVWRGQQTCTIIPTSWFSTSLYPHVATGYATKCIFRIHLEPGIRVLNMYDFYAAHGIRNPHTETNAVGELMGDPEMNFSHDYANFGEVLVEEGGTFWANASHTRRGFRKIGYMRSSVPPDDLPPPNNPNMPATIVLKATDYPLLPVYETYYSRDCEGGRGCIITG